MLVLRHLGAVQLASLIPRFNNVIALKLRLRHCCAAALDTLVTSFTYKPLKKLILEEITLTPAATKELGQSLPEMSSLENLELSGVDGSILQAEQMEALFGRFNKTLPLLKWLSFRGFNVRGCFAPLMKSLRFFPNLRFLWLEKLNIDEHDQCSLLKRSGSLARLEEGINILLVDSFHWCSDKYATIIDLCVRSLSPALAAMLGRLLPELSSLQDLQLNGLCTSILQAEEMEALFGGFNKTVPLCRLAFMNFSAGGCLFPLFKSFRFFPNLESLKLNRLNMDEHDLRGLLESFQFIPNLKLLSLAHNPLGHAVTSLVPPVMNLKRLVCLDIDNTGSSVEDFNYVRDTAQQALPGLKL